jgi:SulP family sulfate permease
VGIEPGIGVGVAASLALFVLRSTRPHNAVLGRLPGTDVFRNVKNFPEAEPVPGMVIWRFDASFYFANADFFRDQVDRIILEDGALDGETIHTLLVDASGINDLDASAVTTLEDLDDRLARANVKLAFANLKGPVREVMERGHFLERLGDDRVFLDVPQAVAALGDTGSRPRGVVRPAA